VSSTDVLIERERELAQVPPLLERARSAGGGLLVFGGPGGIGKSTLLQVARRQAEALEMRVLSARASELTRDFAFGVVRHLLEPALAGEGEAPFAGAAVLARPLFDPSAELDPGSDASFPLMHGLQWLASNLAAAQPLLIAVDDAHWADGPSLRWLLYLAQSLDELPIAVVVAARAAEAGPNADVIAQLAAAPVSRSVQVRPLSRAGVGAVIRNVTSSEPDDEFCDACFDLTRGNPFLLIELLRALADDGLKPDHATVAIIRTLAPDAVLRAVVARLGRLSPEAVALARAVAILRDDARLADAAALAQLDVDHAAAATGELSDAGVFERELPLRFVHPLVAAAVEADVPVGERGLMHRRAADILRDRGAEVERIASHLLQSVRTGDGWAVGVLREAARRSAAQGAPEASVDHLRRALAEPPPEERRATVLRELGAVEAALGSDLASRRFHEALELETEPRTRAETRRALARALYVQGKLRDACLELGSALDELGGADPELAVHLRSEYGQLATLDPALLATLELPAAEPPASGSALTAADRAWLAQTALMHTLSAQPSARAVHLARRAWHDGRLLAEEGADSTTLYAITFVLLLADELALDDRVLTEAIDDARRRGSVMGFATASFCRWGPRFFAGRLHEAAADVTQALEARRYGWEQYLPTAYAFLAQTQIELGDLDQAEATLAEAFAGREPDSLPWGPVFAARGRLNLARGDLDRAGDDFATWSELVGPMLNPMPHYANWRSNVALVESRRGRHDEARRLIDEEVEHAGRSGAGLIVGASLRAAALVEPGTPEALDRLERSVTTLEQSPSQLELCRSLVAWGSELRRAGRRADAREPLRRALDMAARFGAKPLADRAEEELAATGARPRRRALTGVEALTPSELRVAEMAAAGMTNREIAEALFVTIKAVRWHLGNVYRKLDVDSRDELAAALRAL
jgi:DNA-binding CsgD family transcriptional regulator